MLLNSCVTGKIYLASFSHRKRLILKNELRKRDNENNLDQADN